MQCDLISKFRIPYEVENPNLVDISNLVED